MRMLVRASRLVGCAKVLWMFACPVVAAFSQSGMTMVRIRACTVTSLAFASERRR